MTSVQTIALSIPADPVFLSVARMFGSSVAKTFGLDPQRTEDLRLALSEICAAVAEGESETSPPAIDIDVSWDETALRFSCSRVPVLADGPRWMLIQALMPDVHVGEAAEPTVSFSVDR